MKVVLSSNKIIDKGPEYDYIHPWLATGLLTSTGTFLFALFSFSKRRMRLRFVLSNSSPKKTKFLDSPVGYAVKRQAASGTSGVNCWHRHFISRFSRTLSTFSTSRVPYSSKGCTRKSARILTFSRSSRYAHWMSFAVIIYFQSNFPIFCFYRVFSFNFARTLRNGHGSSRECPKPGWFWLRQSCLQVWRASCIPTSVMNSAC